MAIKDTTCITYNNPTHDRFQKEFERLYRDKFSHYHAFTRGWIEQTDFFKENQQVFQYEKYAGFFLWKPYCIYTTLLDTSDSNILYCDSNLRFNNFNKFEQLYKDTILRDGVFFIKHRNHINKDWTKRDTFILMDADSSEYWNANQVWSVVLGFDKSIKSVNILEDYLHFCKNENIVTELPNKYGENLEGFREHRWEQSVISILAQRYKVDGIWDTDVLDIIYKVYDIELTKYKENINKDSLKKVR